MKKKKNAPTATKVGKIATQVRGVTYSKHEVENSPRDGYVPILRAMNITEHGLTYDDLVYVPEAKVHDRQMLQPGDIVVAASSGSLEIVGKASVVETSVKASFGAFCKVVRPGTEVYPAYLGHFFRTPDYRSTISRLAQGANINNLKNEHIDDLEIPLPSFDEQIRIAAVLDKADALLRHRQESLELTEKLLKSIFNDAFGDPITNPNNWDVVPLGSLVADGDTINYGVVQPGNDFTGGVPLIRLGDLASPDPMMTSVKRIDPAIDASYDRSRLAGGEVLIGCVGHTIGVSCIAPREWAGANIARAVARVNLSPGISPEFILQQIRTPAIQHFFRGERRIVGQPTLNIKQIKEAPFLLPPPELRDRFGLIYRSTLEGHTDKQRSKALGEQLFSAIQQRAFRGELDLSRLQLDAKVETPVVPPLPQQSVVQGRYTRPGSFIAPPDIEAQMMAMEDQLDAGPGDSIPWSEDFFKYRTLSQVLQPPFTFKELWEAVRYDMEEASYETVKDKVFEYVAAGILVQTFDETRKEIVLSPRP